jgi:hypothetical protein
LFGGRKAVQAARFTTVVRQDSEAETQGSFSAWTKVIQKRFAEYLRLASVNKGSLF